MVNAGPEGVAFRDAPATGERLRLLKDGESLERIGDEETLAAEKRWWKIRDGEGKEGWASREFLLKDTDVEERARFMEYGRAMWRLAALSDKSNAEVFDAMRGVSSPAQIVVAYAVAQRNVNTHADLLTTARGISTTDRGNQARQSLVDVLTTRKQTAEKIAKALATRTDRDLETAKQAIESSQTAMIPFAANFVGLALDLRVDYQTEFKD